ncbi:unnamed protein product, partial [marine sediment metagenome]
MSDVEDTKQVFDKTPGDVPGYPLVETDGGALPAPWEPQPGEMAAVYSTLADPLDTIRAINDTLPATALKDAPAKIVDVVVHSATVHTETGEILNVARSILVS